VNEGDEGGEAMGGMFPSVILVGMCMLVVDWGDGAEVDFKCRFQAHTGGEVMVIVLLVVFLDFLVLLVFWGDR